MLKYITHDIEISSDEENYDEENYSEKQMSFLKEKFQE